MPATFAFDAESWSTCIPKPIFLTQVFRQKDNSTVMLDFYPLCGCSHLPAAFVDILASMRTGVLTAAHVEQLQRLSRPLYYADGIEPTEL
jgi:hypothetical protein